MDVENKKADSYKTSRILYIIEAALEYFVSIAVGTVYLAKIATYIGISDALTGILTSFVSLGCAFQIVAIFLSKYKPVKRWVTLLHIVSQTMFALLYIVPLTPLSRTVKTVVFILLLLLAHIVHNVINAPKINWFMSLVEDKKRGKFTANKEIVSLVGGMVISYLLGLLIDYYSGTGEIRTAFILTGVGLFALMILHSLTLIFSKEKPSETQSVKFPKTELKELLQNKNIFKLILVSALWNIANYATVSFSGTYQTKELGFSTTFASVIVIVGSFARVCFSKPFGRFADKHSFANMLCICFAVEAVAFGINTFTLPTNGKAVYFIYYVFYCIGQAGINSSLINLIFDYVKEEQRTSALALNQTIYGLSGFLITLALSPILAVIQRNGNSVFGIPLYAQQLFSLFSAVVSLGLIAYILFVVKKIKREENQ